MDYMRRQSMHSSSPSSSTEQHFSHQPHAKAMQRVRAQRRSSVGGLPSRDGTAARMRHRTTLDTLSSVLPSFLPAPKTGEEAAGTAGGSFSCCANGVDEIFQQAARERDTTIQYVQENNGYGMYKWREIQSRLVSANIRTNLAAQMVISTIFEESSQNCFRSNLGGATGCQPDDEAATRAHRTSRRCSDPLDLANDAEEEEAAVMADVQTNISCAAFCQRAATSTVMFPDYRNCRYLLGHKGGGGENKSPEESASSEQCCSDGLISVMVDGVRDDCARRISGSGSGSDDSEGCSYDDNAAPCESKEQNCSSNRCATKDPVQQPDLMPPLMHSVRDARLPEALVQSDLMPQDVTRRQELRQEQPPITCGEVPPGKDADVCGDEEVQVDCPRNDCEIGGVLHTGSAAVSAAPDAPNKEGERRGLSGTRVVGVDSCRHDATEGAIDHSLGPESPVRDGNKCDVAIEAVPVASKNDERTKTVVSSLKSPLVKIPIAQGRRRRRASMYASATPALAALEDHNPLYTPLPSIKFQRAPRRCSMGDVGCSTSSSTRPRQNVIQTTSSNAAGIIFKSKIDHCPNDTIEDVFVPSSWSSPTTATATQQQLPNKTDGKNGRRRGSGTPMRTMRRRNSREEGSSSSVNSEVEACASIIFSNFSASSAASN